ncbi:MAG: flavin monoamine oxidase family protein [Alphaproteobacteria bacterium]
MVNSLKIGRRAFLAGTAGALAMPFVARASGPTDTDIVIIGAGAAGLAAARGFQARNISFKLIEVRDRIGGRGFTNTEYFGVPVDFGCSELHHGRRNPFVAYAQQNGFKVSPLPGDAADRILVGNRPASKRQMQAMEQVYERHQQALSATCDSPADISAAKAFANLNPGGWAPSVRLWMGPVSAGVDMDDFSAHDWCSSPSGQNWHAPAGFGTLIAHYGRAVPVRLKTRAQEVIWTNRGVRVVTDAGTIKAKAVVVTVPLGVLQAGSIRFTPTLPAWMSDALAGMDMANYTKILLKFRAHTFDQPAGSWLAGKINERDGFSFWINPGGHGVVQAIAGGAYALALELAGENVAVDAALSVLRAMLGARIEQSFVEGTMTYWNQDPFSRGAWGVAKPGQFHQRARLARPVGGRIYFAGEANHRQFWSTAGGALLVGAQVAKHIATRLPRL